MVINIEKGYKYKRLIPSPSGDGICTEDTIDEFDSSTTDLSSKLFKYISLNKLHIFCIYIKNADESETHPAYEHAKNLLCENPGIDENLSAAIRSEPTTIQRTTNFSEFKEFLAHSMARYNLPFNLRERFKASLSEPYNNSTSLFPPYIDNLDTRQTLICFITRDTYEALKSCYSLPYDSSSVVQMSPSTMVENDVLTQLTNETNKDETIINNQEAFYHCFKSVLDKYHISYSTEDETQSAFKSFFDSFLQETNEKILKVFESFAEINIIKQNKKTDEEITLSTDNTI